MDFNLFQKDFNTEVPEAYKCLENLIGLSSLNLEYYDSSEDFEFRITKWINCNNIDQNVKIDSFFKKDELLAYWMRHIENWGLPIAHLPIGNTCVPHNGLILLGIDKDNNSQILLSESGSKETVLLYDDISIFLNSITQELHPDKLRLVSKLFKNFDEDFYRIKE
jgi:hypothetical protein